MMSRLLQRNTGSIGAIDYGLQMGCISTLARKQVENGELVLIGGNQALPQPYLEVSTPDLRYRRQDNYPIRREFRRG